MKSIIIIICLLFTVCSCSDNFLEIYPETSLNEGNFYQSDEELTILVNGCYVPLSGYSKRDHWIMSELKSDNMTIQVSSSAGDFSSWATDALLAGSDDLTIKDFWNLSYNGIYRCNKVISIYEELIYTWSNEELKNRSIGEVYFLRALYYFDLVRQFGDVPLVTKNISGKEAVAIKRSPVDEVYKLIISDLNNAQEHLSEATQIEVNGRVNESAALGLLGKVYLTQKDYIASEKVLKMVIVSGKFSLLPNYADLFNPVFKDFKETIFSVQCSEGAADLSNNFIFFNAPYLSKGDVTNRPNIALALAGNMQPSQDLIDAFEVGDKRKNVSINYWTGPDWTGVISAIPYCSKYKPPQSSPLNWCGDNFPVLRYSDILLMYAEVLNNQGRTMEASSYVFMVRERAGLTNDISDLSKSNLDLLIEKERQVEFCFENQRWYDLVRRDRVLEVMNAHFVSSIYNNPYFSNAFVNYPLSGMAPYQILAALPGEQILVNKLEQNPGY